MWIGAIISRIRWISAPRCWILENHRHHNEREEGTYQGHASSSREGALAWVAGHLVPALSLAPTGPWVGLSGPQLPHVYQERLCP